MTSKKTIGGKITFHMTNGTKIIRDVMGTKATLKTCLTFFVCFPVVAVVFACVENQRKRNEK